MATDANQGLVLTREPIMSLSTEDWEAIDDDDAIGRRFDEAIAEIEACINTLEGMGVKRYSLTTADLSRILVDIRRLKALNTPTRPKLGQTVKIKFNDSSVAFYDIGNVAFVCPITEKTQLIRQLLEEVYSESMMAEI